MFIIFQIDVSQFKKTTLMQKSLDLQIDMHTNTQGVCNNNQALLATILVYVASKLKLDTNITSEKKLAALLGKLAKNSAVPKNLSRTAAIPVFLDLSSNLSSFAWNKGDMKLYLEVTFTKTSLQTATDIEFVRSLCAHSPLPSLLSRPFDRTRFSFVHFEHYR